MTRATQPATHDRSPTFRADESSQPLTPAITTSRGASPELVQETPEFKEPDREETILLVEDDSALRELTRDVLRRNGFHVLTADSDGQALWLWGRHAHRISLLLTDLMIPNRTTGVELAKKMRAERPELPVIFVSGFGMEVEDGEIGFLRKSPFLQKPYSSARLIQTVVNCLAQNRKHRGVLN